MTRPLRVLDDDPTVVLAALRDALDGSGPAILPHRRSHDPAPGTVLNPVPAEVPRRVAVVIETSGSTGHPKRVALSADALLASAAASETALGGPGQWLLALPAHYVAGVNVLVRSVTSRTIPVILPDGHFDPLAFVEASDAMDSELRFASIVPTQLLRLLDAAEQGLPVLERLRRFDRLLIGGQAISSALLARAIELGLNIARSYGSSETAGGCVYDGVPLAGVDVRIVDGEVQLGGVTLAEGYLGDEERTAAAFPEEHGKRWYRTGDAGRLDDGILSVTGRLDSVLISGGVKVALAEVERVVSSLPGLADAVVVSAKSREWGEVPVVFTAGSAPLEEVRSAVQAAIGPAARPAAVITVQSIPLLASGKPDRVAIAAMAADRA